MPDRVYLAIDLGAESGRVMAGLWNGKTIRLEEVHRFPNSPVYLGDSLRWDVVRLWAEIQSGLTLAAKKYGQAMPCHPSPFLKELPPDLVEDADEKSKQPVAVASGKDMFAAMRAALG